MSGIQRLTNSSDETELAQLLQGDLVFSIPYFQRAYKWKSERLRQLEQDLLGIIDAEDTHFLGAVIVYARRTNPADPNVYEVIDGQQRTTTVFLYICAIVRALCKEGLYDEAAGLFLKYLVVGFGRDSKLASNSKLHSCKEDRGQLNRVFEDLMSDGKFSEVLDPFKYKPLASSGQSTGRLWSNYRAARRFIESQVRLEGQERLRALYKALLNYVSVVQIVVRNPTDGPKIFDSLNSRQEPMTTGDLVRNEIFAKVANQEAEVIEAIDQGSWQPFYRKFSEDGKSLFDAYFFPYGLIQDPNVRKSEVFEMLRTRWKSISEPAVIIEKLAVYQRAFLDVVRGTNSQEHSLAVAQAFRRLNESAAPSSTYPFLMQLSNAARDGDVCEADALDVLSVIEAFLVRRALCGHEPTGLHAVFKRLWLDCEGSPSAENVKTAIKKHRTVVWPDDADVRAAILKRPLYGSSITPFVLMELNRSVGGDQPASVTWIEHVLPVKPSSGWFDTFTRDQHELQKDLLSNLLPLSMEMNRALSNGPYSRKRQVYADDSGFKAARKFAEKYSEWGPVALEERSGELADWVVSRWRDG